MSVPRELPVEEVKRLQRCINDLLSILALPAIWSGGEPSRIIHTLLDSLLGMLGLDLVYVRVNAPVERPLEMVRVITSRTPMPSPEQIREVIDHWLGTEGESWPPPARQPIEFDGLSLVRLPLGLQGELGILVAGARRASFPERTETLLLSVAANQAAIGLQEARILSEQRRLARELDHQVAQRTMELGRANEELRGEIAERRRAEERLKRSEAFLAEAQRVSSTGSFSWQVETGQVIWSEQLYRTFGFEPSVPLTLELIRERLHPEDVPSFDNLIQRARSGTSHLEYEHRLLMPDHSVRHLHLVAHGRQDPTGRLEYLGAVQDVTQRRLAEEALGQARTALAQVASASSLGVLTAAIAHEVNQPLSGIITNASTCLRMLATDPPNLDGARETARRTIRDGDRASQIIARLRALFSKRSPTPEALDLNEATREVITLSASELRSNRVVLRTDLAEDLPLVTGDRVQLQQVILNLLRNASDAMSEVNDRPRELVIMTTRDDDAHVRLTVQDAGVGFDRDAADRLFEPFYTSKTDGMGIGLSVSRSIIEAHQGRLWATLNEGPGASFSFSIPTSC